MTEFPAKSPWILRPKDKIPQISQEISHRCRVRVPVLTNWSASARKCEYPRYFRAKFRWYWNVLSEYPWYLRAKFRWYRKVLSEYQRCFRSKFRWYRKVLWNICDISDQSSVDIGEFYGISAIFPIKVPLISECFMLLGGSYGDVPGRVNAACFARMKGTDGERRKRLNIGKKLSFT